MCYCWKTVRKWSMSKCQTTCCINAIFWIWLSNWWQDIVNRSTYIAGVCTNSVCTDLHNFVTRRMTHYMDCMCGNLMMILKENKKLLNLSTFDLRNEINYCTIILYYADPKRTVSVSHGSLSDCWYSVSTVKFDI